MKPALCIAAVLFLGALLVACRGLGARELKPDWVAPLATKGPPLVANGRVFVWGFPAGKPGDPYRIYALDARTGKEIWSVPAGREPNPLDSRPQEWMTLGHQGRSLVLWDGSSVRALDAATGQPLDERMARQLRVMQRLAIEGAAGVGVDDEQQLRCIDVRDGSTLWRAPLPKASPTGEAFDHHHPYVQAGTVLVSSGYIRKIDGRTSESRFVLSAFDPATGAPRWTYVPGLLGNEEKTEPGTIRYLGFVEVVGLGKTLFLTTDETWNVKIGPGSTSSFAMKTLTALDPASGSVRWRIAPGGRVLGLTADEAWVTISTLDAAARPIHVNVGIDVRTGKESWRRDWSIDGRFLGATVWKEIVKTQMDWKRTYTGDRRGSKDRVDWFSPDNVHKSALVVRDPRTNRDLWKTPALRSTVMSEPVASEGRVFVATVAEMADGRSGVWAFKAQ